MLLLNIFFCLWGPVNFFCFLSHVDQTVDRVETRVEFTETENLSKNSAGRRQRNLVTVEVFESMSTKLCRPTCVVTERPLVRDDSSSRDKATTSTKMQATVDFRLRMYGYSSLHTNVKARDNSKNN